MSKFNELYGYLSDRQTPHLFVMAEIMYSIKESMDQHNQQMTQLNEKLETLIGLTREQGKQPPESSEA